MALSKQELESRVLELEAALAKAHAAQPLLSVDVVAVGDHWYFGLRDALLSFERSAKDIVETEPNAGYAIALTRLN